MTVKAVIFFSFNPQMEETPFSVKLRYLYFICTAYLLFYMHGLSSISNGSYTKYYLLQVLYCVTYQTALVASHIMDLKSLYGGVSS